MANDTAAVGAKKTTKTTATPRKAPARKAATEAPQQPATAPPSPPPGWYVDPADPAIQRYWDGGGWIGEPLPAAATPPAGPVTPTSAAPAALETITFMGRTMRVAMPTAEQLVVWKRLANRAAAIQGQMSNEDAARLLDRALKIIIGVLVDEADRDWVEDQLLEGTLTLVDTVDAPGAVQIISLTIAAYKAKAETAAPTTGPAPKARRRR